MLKTFRSSTVLSAYRTMPELERVNALQEAKYILPSVYRLDHHRQQQHISADFIDRLKVRTFVSISVDNRSTEIKDVVYVSSRRVLP